MFPVAGDRELKDLSDRRHRKRGEATRKERLDKGWYALESIHPPHRQGGC